MDIHFFKAVRVWLRSPAQICMPHDKGMKGVVIAGDAELA
jgi:hypothetical protein